MKKRIACALACAALLLPRYALADDFEKRAVIGNWFVSTSQDRFNDSASTQVALTMADGYALGVKCQDKQLTLSWANSREGIQGKVFRVKLRVDKNPIVETVGQSLGTFVQIATTDDFVKSMRAGRETAVRIANEDGVYTTTVFKMNGAQKALAGVARECGIDEKVTH